jgi:protein TonB
VPNIRFESLVLTEAPSLGKARSLTVTVSVIVHSALVAAFLIVPLLFEEMLPEPGQAVKAFFASPVDVAPPPPPPPPPAAGPRPAQPTTAPRPLSPTAFVAPIDIPADVKPVTGLDLGVEGGVAGGVEGGIPGGVVGGIVGGLPTVAEPPKVVRIGGQLTAPKMVHQVPPVYPDLALKGRVSAVIILEALVDVRGAVKDVKVLRGHPLFDEAALAAVHQWRYQPLLLNGEPTEFILSVTVMFNFKGGVTSQ